MDAAQAQTLWDTLALVPDQRGRHGRRFTLQSVLAVAVGALLGGRKGLAAIARWGRSLSRSELRQLGIERDKAPCHSTYHNILKGLKVEALEKCLGQWVCQGGQPGQTCLDGKTLRGSRSADYPALHLLALYSEQLQGVMAQIPVGSDENEVTAALRILKEVSLEGMILSGDAEFTQKGICEQVTEGGGDYFLVVKDNQPTLKGHIETAFTEPFSPLGEADVAAGGAVGSQRR
jgi:hypothetical protein